MKVKRTLLCAIAALLALAGCSSSNDQLVNESSVRKLNISQADIIASVTDNAKYLNESLLYNVDTLDDSDTIGVIVRLNSKGLIDEYQKNTLGYDSIGEYASSSTGLYYTGKMVSQQDKIVSELKKENLIENVKYSYTTLFNGIACETTYGNYKKLREMKLVEDITVCEAYSLPQSKYVGGGAVENVVDVYETGIFNSSEAAKLGYNGDNTSVAILDSGFDVHHSVFASSECMPTNPMISKDDVNAVMSDLAASSFSNGLKVEDVYLNKKIPFAYDYADKDEDVAPYDSDHGTHVAGIIGGYDDVVTGVAVHTQLVLMKVFGDYNNGALQEDICAALEDAVVLGVDAINLSLGQACGFSTSRDEAFINVVYDKIKSVGISLVVAASNDYSSGYGGAESNTAKASNPDTATVGSPGTFEASLSIASISGVKSKYITTEDGYTFFFNDANNLNSKPYDFYEMLLENENIPAGEDYEVEYVTVPGYGRAVNYSSINVKGKIALVKRGELNFEDKAKFAYEAGAIGCIVYNNIGGDIFMSAGNTLKIPFCSISMDDGEYLASKSTGKLIFNTNNLAGPFMSDFSSWGPTPDLKLKPEITAHGGTITSAVPGGGYDEISGTSMAAPNLCGVALLVRQYLKEIKPELEEDPVTLTKMANQILMSTSTIILDKQGEAYSPRKQGSGLANLMNALNTKAYITVDGIDTTKLDLGDDKKKTGEYKLEFNVVNMSNEELTYKISDITMTESLSTANPKYIAEQAYLLNTQSKVFVSGNGSESNGLIKVSPNGTVKVIYEIKLNEADMKYMRQSFVNGTYVEGFAVLEDKNGTDIDLSIPFLAFYGDWTVAPMLDKTYYEVESEAYNNAIDDEDKIKADYYATTPLGSYYYSYIIPLGSYVYKIDESKYDAIPASEEHASMSYTLESINGITCVYAGLLRGARKVTTTIVNTETGEVKYEHFNYDQRKSYFSNSIVPSYDLINVTAYDLGLENNVNYTFKMSAELDYEDGGVDTNLNNSFEFTFYVDNNAPVMVDAEYYAKYDKSRKENRYYADLYIYDNHYAMSVRPYVIIDGELSTLTNEPIPIYAEERGTVTKVTIEITDYMDYLQYGSSQGYQLTNGIGFMIDDYALNASYYYTSLPGTNATSLGFVDEDGKTMTNVNVSIGEEFDLTKYITSNDPDFNADALGQQEFMGLLNWKSSNENIVRVKNGKIEGIKRGTTYITVNSIADDGSMPTASIKVTVRQDITNLTGLTANNVNTLLSDGGFTNKVKLEDLEFTHFETLNAFLDGAEYSDIGQTGDVHFITSKPNISFYPSERVQLYYQITPWNLDSSRYELVWSSTKPEVASVDENGVVTGLKEGSTTVTLKIYVDGKLSNITAKISVIVKSEFVIEGGQLVAYKGLGGDVVIPDDEGIRMISSFAFSLYTTDYSIKIENDDYDGAKTPGGNETIKSVVIPYTVTEIGKAAFYNCTALETVYFQKDEKGTTCNIIRDYAFYGCKNLKNINSEDILVIGAQAFAGCTGLETFDFSGIYAIGAQGFKGCTGLNNIDLTTLRSCGIEAFINCTNLTNVETGQYTKYSNGMFKNTGLTSVKFYSDRIPANCFANCDSLVSVEIVNNIIYVGENAFANCDSLVSVAIQGSCDFIYKNAFANSNINQITLPNSNVEFEEGVFSGCRNLEKLVFQANTYILVITNIFNDCDLLDTFDTTNSLYYSSNGSYIYNKDETAIVLASHKNNYNDLVLENITINDGAFSGVKTINTLSLSNVNVGAYAFGYCTNLTALTMNNIQEFEEGVFYHCKALKNIGTSNTIEYSSKYAYAYTGLEEVIIPNEIIAQGLFMGSLLKTVSFSSTNVEIGAYAFKDCANLTTVNSSNIVAIGDYAFYDANILENIDLSNVTIIEDYAFYGNRKFVDVNLTAAVNIGAYAFSNNINLEAVTIPNVQTIKAYAFSTTTKNANTANKLQEVTMPSIVSIGEYAFASCNKLVTVNLGDLINNIDSFAFSNCILLENVLSNGSVDTIKEGTFMNDTNLVNVSIKNIGKVEAGAFYNCKNLETIDLTNVVEIGSEAFYYNTGLKELNLESLKTIYSYAFYYANSVEVLNIPVIEYIDACAFSQLKVKEIILPATISYVAETAFFVNTVQQAFKYNGGNGLVTTGVINETYLLDNGALYNVLSNDKYQLLSYPAGKTDSEYTVIDNTLRIATCAASYNEYITKVTLPDTLTLLGNFAFDQCKKLNTVEFRSTVAPTLESFIYDSVISYPTDSEIHNLLNRYLNFNGADTYYYGQFVDWIGLATKLNIILPSNKNLEGYDNVLYKLYFDVENATISNVVSKDKYTLDFINKIKLVPTENIRLSDEELIVGARTAYNLLKQDLSDFGYEQSEIDSLLNNLSIAEGKVKELKIERINERYADLILDIENLGSTYKYELISEYKRILELLDRIDKEDKKLIDITSFEEFQKQYNEYFDDLDEAIKTLDTITTLPTSQVNIRTASIVRTSIITSILGAINTAGFFILKKRWFLF